jgi:hypothetical protein
MQHPTPERLAELADVIPDADEAEHLTTCAACAREVHGFRSLSGMAAHMSAPGINAPVSLTNWDSLSERLRAEGLIRSPAEDATRVRAERVIHARRGGQLFRGSFWVMRLAAGLLLFLAGALAGRSVLAPQVDSGAPPAELTVVDGEPQFASEGEARAVLSRAERDYQLASTWLAAEGVTDDELFDADLIRTRLAVFDAAAGAAREAIFDAPHDPVINQYYMSTLAAREATLHQLASALPSGISRF